MNIRYYKFCSSLCYRIGKYQAVPGHTMYDRSRQSSTHSPSQHQMTASSQDHYPVQIILLNCPPYDYNKSGNVRLLQWKSNKYLHITTVCVCSLGHPACNAACAILSSVACPALQYSSTLTHKRFDFRKKKTVIKYKMCVLTFSAIFVWNTRGI